MHENPVYKKKVFLTNLKKNIKISLILSIQRAWNCQYFLTTFSFKLVQTGTHQCNFAFHLWKWLKMRHVGPGVGKAYFFFDRFYPYQQLTSLVLCDCMKIEWAAAAGLDNGKCLNFQMFTHKGIRMCIVYVLLCSSHSLRLGWFYRVP